LIVAEQKSLEEIRRMIAPYPRILILGCGTCMTVCNAGGESEVSFLHHSLRLAEARSGDGIHTFTEHTIKRQCDPEFLEALTEKATDVDVILSLGCGIGVQAIAERLEDMPVLPGVNTSFMGMIKEFKEFAVRGNVMDMAVGIIVGAAFGKIVSSFVGDVIMPPIGVLVGGIDFSNLAITVKEAAGEIPAVVIGYGKFIQTVLDFLIIAFAIFIVIKGMNSLKKKAVNCESGLQVESAYMEA